MKRSGKVTDLTVIKKAIAQHPLMRRYRDQDNAHFQVRESKGISNASVVPATCCLRQSQEALWNTITTRVA
jgi:hypothetical protein